MFPNPESKGKTVSKSKSKSKRPEPKPEPAPERETYSKLRRAAILRLMSRYDITQAQVAELTGKFQSGISRSLSRVSSGELQIDEIEEAVKKEAESRRLLSQSAKPA